MWTSNVDSWLSIKRNVWMKSASNPVAKRVAAQGWTLGHLGLISHYSLPGSPCYRSLFLLTPNPAKGAGIWAYSHTAGKRHARVNTRISEEWGETKDRSLIVWVRS